MAGRELLRDGAGEIELSYRLSVGIANVVEHPSFGGDEDRTKVCRQTLRSNGWWRG